MASGWNSNFYFHNRRPQFQLTVSSLPMVVSDSLHCPHRLVGRSCPRHVHRDFRPY